MVTGSSFQLSRLGRWMLGPDIAALRRPTESTATPRAHAATQAAARELAVCGHADCVAFADQTRTAWQAVVEVEPRRCACCAGSASRRAILGVLPQLLRRRAYRLLLVGCEAAAARCLAEQLGPLGIHVSRWEALPADARCGALASAQLVVSAARATACDRHDSRLVRAAGGDVEAICSALGGIG